MHLLNRLSGSLGPHPLAHGQTCPTCARPIPALLPDAAAQTPSHSVASADVATQLPLTEFFLGCVYSNDPLDRSVSPPTHGNASSASLPQPIDITTIYSPSSTSCTSGRSAPRARLHSTPPNPPGLEDQAYLRFSHGIPVKAAPVRPKTDIHFSFIPAATCKYHQCGNTCLLFSSHLHKECKYRPCGNPSCRRCRPTCETCTFSKATRPGTLHDKVRQYET